MAKLSYDANFTPGKSVCENNREYENNEIGEIMLIMLGSGQRIDSEVDKKVDGF